MYQKIHLIGRVGQEPQMRYTPEGTPVTSFSVATTETVSKNAVQNCPNGWKESYNGKNWELTTWWRVTCWRGLAETVNTYLSKGRQVFVVGKVNGEASDGVQNVRVWEANDGSHRASYEITAATVKFLGSRDDADNGGSGAYSGEAPPDLGGDDELPF